MDVVPGVIHKIDVNTSGRAIGIFEFCGKVPARKTFSGAINLVKNGVESLPGHLWKRFQQRLSDDFFFFLRKKRKI
jgi:hypothetical protein